MTFVCDQNVERRITWWLAGQRYGVRVGVVDYDGRLPDEDILALALRDGRTLMTNDKDFGELIWRNRLPHAGVILLRLPNATPDEKILRLQAVLAEHAASLSEFIVVTHARIRVRRRRNPDSA